MVLPGFTVGFGWFPVGFEVFCQGLWSVFGFRGAFDWVDGLKKLYGGLQWLGHGLILWKWRSYGPYINGCSCWNEQPRCCDAWLPVLWSDFSSSRQRGYTVLYKTCPAGPSIQQTAHIAIITWSKSSHRLHNGLTPNPPTPITLLTQTAEQMILTAHAQLRVHTRRCAVFIAPKACQLLVAVRFHRMNPSSGHLHQVRSAHIREGGQKDSPEERQRRQTGSYWFGKGLLKVPKSPGV